MPQGLLASFDSEAASEGQNTSGIQLVTPFPEREISEESFLSKNPPGTDKWPTSPFNILAPSLASVQPINTGSAMQLGDSEMDELEDSDLDDTIEYTDHTNKHSVVPIQNNNRFAGHHLTAGLETKLKTYGVPTNVEIPSTVDTSSGPPSIASGNNSDTCLSEESAGILIQKIFRGHHGRMKAALALEIMNFSSPHLVKSTLKRSQRCVQIIIYSLVALLIIFALYLNLCFGIKFDETQQREWLKSFAGSLFLDLAFGIPVQILVLMSIPREVLKAIWYFILFVTIGYVVNGVAGSEVISMGWFESNMSTFLTVAFGV